MRARRRGSLAADPFLLGAVTVIIIVVAIFLAYNANNGLPFVPTRELRVDVRSASDLVRGNDVRIGGFRVGAVSKIDPVVLPGGRAGARLTLKLDPHDGVVPVDSRVVIRSHSALGLKYVDLVRGQASATLADGATLPAAQARVPVQIEDVLSTFDQPTRLNVRRVLVGTGDALAGRGADLNDTLGELPPLFGHLTPVASTLAAPRTRLRAFVRGLGRAAQAVAPVAGEQAVAIGDLGTTFEAISHDTTALRATLEKSPPTLAVVTRSLRVQQPFLADTALLGADLHGAAVSLRAALPDLNAALEAGTPVLTRSVTIDPKLADAFVALRHLSEAPGTNIALRALTATVASLNPQLRFLGPYITTCNYLTTSATFLGEHFSEEDAAGYAERALLNSAGPQDDTVSPVGTDAKRPANGKGYPAAGSVLGAPQHLHTQPYGAAITSSGAADCETGQRGYPEGRLTSPLTPKDLRIVTSPHTPGAQGPTYTGLPHVPKGETFSREPNVNALDASGNRIIR